MSHDQSAYNFDEESAPQLLCQASSETTVEVPIENCTCIVNVGTGATFLIYFHNKLQIILLFKVALSISVIKWTKTSTEHKGRGRI